MVISQKILEKEMGNRGSKSDFITFIAHLFSYVILGFTITFIAHLFSYVILGFTPSETTDLFSFMAAHSFLLSAVAPLVVYNNADTQKTSILSENRGKSGVYRWIYKETGKFYVGSAVNLSKRFVKYYSIKEISKGTMSIYKALLKYGYSMFILEILEYCKPEVLIEREQYYIDLLKPEYNILTTAGSLLGFKHSEETKKKMREVKLGRIFSEETLAKLRARRHTKETIAKIRGAQKVKCKALEVTDLETNQTVSYDSIRAAARALSCAPSAIQYSLKNPDARPYKGRYKFLAGNKV
jgi:group I intron endonuclease